MIDTSNALRNPRRPNGKFWPCNSRGRGRDPWCNIACPGSVYEPDTGVGCGWGGRPGEAIRSRRFTETNALDTEANDMFESIKTGEYESWRLKRLIRRYGK